MSMADVILAQNRILKPIASYTHTTNKEVAVSAVDVDTDTFTSVAHGLANNDVIFPIINHDAGAVFPLAVYAGGMAQGTYYVVNKADDAFQISLTNGGAAVNLTTNASIDLTKWHFEKGNTMTIAISNLPAAKEYRAIAKIKSAKIESFYFNPSANPAISPWYNMDWAASGSTVYAFRYFASLNATIYGYIEAFFSTEVHALKKVSRVYGWVKHKYCVSDSNDRCLALE